MAKKVLMLLSNDYSPDPRVEKEAFALVKAGYEVTVLAWNRQGSKPCVETRDGLVVRRVMTAFPPRKGLPFGHLEFLARSLIEAIRRRPDIIHSHDLDTLFQGAVSSRIIRASLVYDSHEYYAMMVRSDVGGTLSRFIDSLERLIVSNADLVVAANQRVLEHFPAPIKDRSIVVMNCVNLPVLERRTGSETSRLRIFYGGSLEPERFIPELLQATMKDDRIELRIAGRGRYEPDVLSAAKACDRIKFLGYLSQKEILAETLASDVVFSLLSPDNKNYLIATPVKMIEAMTLGIPVLASKGTLCGEIVEREGAGIAIDWSLEEFEGAITILMNPAKRASMGENGMMAARRDFSWKEMERRLLEAYSSLGHEVRG